MDKSKGIALMTAILMSVAIGGLINLIPFDAEVRFAISLLWVPVIVLVYFGARNALSFCFH